MKDTSMKTPVSVPFFSLTQQWQTIKETTLPKIEALLDSQHMVGGPTVQKFEAAFAHYTQSSYAIGCNSGTDALWLALRALNIAHNDLVLTTPFSFIASSSEIHAHGAQPVFIDVDPITYNLSADKLAAWLNEHAVQKKVNGTVFSFEKTTGQKIAGIIVVNIFGQCADYQALNALKKQYNLWIIEDAAQSVGAHYYNQPSGTLGDISCFSFYPTKNLGAAGDAGMVTTQDATLAATIARLKHHGRASGYNYEHYGVNSRLDGLQALVLHEKLTILDSLLARRRAIAHAYTQRLSKIAGITPPAEQQYHTYHQYCITVDSTQLGVSRDELASKLKEREIGTAIYYPKSLASIPYLQTAHHLYTQCSVTNTLCSSILALPIWPELTDEQVETVITVMEELCEKARYQSNHHPQNNTLV